MSDKESGREKVAWKYIKQTDDDDDRRWAAAGASYDVILGPTSCSGIALMMWYFARVCVCVCVRGEELTEECRQAVMFHIPNAF